MEGRRRRRCGHHRGRWHRRRHRVAAVPGGHPAAPQRERVGGVRAQERGGVVRGAARARRRDPLDGPSDRPRPRTSSRPRSSAIAAGCADGDDDVRGEVRATGSIATPSSPSSARSAPRAASRRGSAPMPCRPSSPRRRDAYVDFLLAEVLPEAARIADAADVFLERGAFDADAGPALPEACARRRSRAPAPRRPVHGVGSDPARGRARRALGRPPRGDRGGRGRRARGERRRRRAAARERALPRQADAARARARRRGRRGRARDRLQPRERVLREPAAGLLARRDADGSRDGGSARRPAR